MDGQDKLFNTGFNNGYIIAKYNPGLLTALHKTISNSGDYVKGFFLGAEEYNIEAEKNRMDDLRKVRKSKSRERGLER